MSEVIREPRVRRTELEDYFLGCGYRPHFVEGSQPEAVHEQMAATLDAIVDEIQAFQQAARRTGKPARPLWPMIVLRTPKGWTGPKEVDGRPVEGHWHSHQVPFGEVRTNPAHRALLENWLKSYRPEQLFTDAGRPRPELMALVPKGARRLGTNPHANGGLLLRELKLPDVRDYAVAVEQPGASDAEATRELGKFLRDVMARNLDGVNFRVVAPDEAGSNRLSAMYEVTDRVWQAELAPHDDHLSANGRTWKFCPSTCARVGSRVIS